MDGAGPMLASIGQRFTYYMACICKGCDYARYYPCHGLTAEMARMALQLFIADLTYHMGLTYNIKPQVIISDQGSCFIAHEFREFLMEGQLQLRLAATYTPQQNSPIERCHGTTFGTARTLLPAANLPPAMHPTAVQTARWIENRLSKPTLGNHSPVF